MLKKIIDRISNILNSENKAKASCKKSFSQCGEDMIVDFIFQSRNIQLPHYIDIGAFNPFLLSNTAFFYEKGAKGINIEPNPDGIQKFYKYRPTDINLNIGIGLNESSLNYYCMSAATMNTFDTVGVEELEKKHGFKVVDVKKISVQKLQPIISKHSNGIFPDFLSLDVEGMDMDILSQIDYEKNYPKVICVETVEYTHDGTGLKNIILIQFLESKGYFVYADTYINTIFVHNKFWFGRENSISFNGNN